MILSQTSARLSFGVVILELITGKPPVLKDLQDGAGERMALAKWVSERASEGERGVREAVSAHGLAGWGRGENGPGQVGK